MRSQAVSLANIRLLIVTIGHAEVAIQASIMGVASCASP